MSSKLFKTAFFLSIVFVAANAFAQTSAVKFNKNNTYAGIEVGSKGVKLSIIEMGKNAAITGAFTALKDTSVNTDFISFTPATFSATLSGLNALYTSAINYGIPSSRIYTVVSSGVKGQAEKENKSKEITLLADSFRMLIREPARAMPVIDALEEARLSHLGIVPEARRYNTFLIDIGSGNTKGGYFRNGNTKELRLFTLTWGTKTIANATEKRTVEDQSVANYNRQLTRVLAGDPEREIVYAVNESGAYNMNDNFAFSGGIAWSIATLLYPELLDNSVVPLDFADLEKFTERLASDFSSFSPAKITAALTDNTLNKEAVAHEVRLVHQVFDQKSLMAGAGLLLKIVRQFEGTIEKKHFYLVKNGQVGWISAYVNRNVNN